MKGYYAIYNHRTNEWYQSGGGWMEDSDTNKDCMNIRTFQTLAEAEQYIANGTIYKRDYKDFFTIRKIYF